MDQRRLGLLHPAEALLADDRRRQRVRRLSRSQRQPWRSATSNGGISNFGIFPYNGISPFGFNGRFIYTKLSLVSDMIRFLNTRQLLGRRALAAMLVSLLISVACNDKETISSPTPALTTVDVTLELSSIEVGQTISASAVALDQFAAPISATSVVYYSNNPKVAIASPTTGKIFAVGPGTAQIIATIDGRSGQRTITVSTAPRIRINEVKSNGDAPGGWVELLNPTASTVDMSGWTLSDSNVLHSVPLPAGTTIPSHGYLLVDEGKFPCGTGCG